MVAPEAGRHSRDGRRFAAERRDRPGADRLGRDDSDCRRGIGRAAPGSVHWRGRCWLVDPLDGTKEFLSGNGEFTVNIALIDGGRPVLGVVFAPALDVMYFAGRGLGAWRQPVRAPRAHRLAPLATRPAGARRREPIASVCRARGLPRSIHVTSASGSAAR